MRRLSCALTMAALAVGVVAETDHPWLFDESDRSGLDAPSDAASAARETDATRLIPAWIEALVSGGIPFGMLFIIR